MPQYTIEMLWTCSVCGEASNRGLARRCHGCGKPKDPEDAERFPDNIGHDTALSGAADRAARAGPDWKCAYCGALQPRLGRCCTNCGVDQDSGQEPWRHKTQRVTADVIGRPHSVQTAVVRSTMIPHVDHHPDAMPPQSEQHAIRADPADAEHTWSIPWPKIGIGAAIAATLCFGWWLLTPRIVEAEVVAVHWEHRVLIDRWQLNAEDGWIPPAGAVDVRQNGTRIHHYDHVRVGSHTESYPEQYACGQDCQTVPGSCSTSPVRCSSNGNGTASCSGGDTTCSPSSQSCSTRYCTRTATRTVDDYEDQPRYAPWYVWKEWGWRHNRTIKKAGSDFETFWPTDAELASVSLGPGERERQIRQAEYATTFRDAEGDTYDLRPADQLHFRDMPLGTRATLKVRRIGSVELVGH